MHTRYSITTPVAEMRGWFDIRIDNDQLRNFKPLEAVFPKHQAPVVRIGDGGERQLVSVEWVLPRQKYQKRQVN